MVPSTVATPTLTASASQYEDVPNDGAQETVGPPRPPFVLNKELLDVRYNNPAKIGHLKIFFGKYRNFTFADVAKDKGYSTFVCGLDAKSENVYLLQRYLNSQGFVAAVPGVRK